MHMLAPELIFSVWLGDVWYALPLVVSISLVYAATRHELMPAIMHHALRVGTWITVFMTVILLVLLVAGWM